jgi:hypothetical protein
LLYQALYVKTDTALPKTARRLETRISMLSDFRFDGGSRIRLSYVAVSLRHGLFAAPLL